jgi:hypothetical protein
MKVNLGYFEMSAETRDKFYSQGLLMSYEDKLALVKSRGWKPSGHWDNWFHPETNWNYGLHETVAHILLEDENSKRDARP